jgi:hypothetical protein
VDFVGSAVATEEKQETKQHTTMPTTAAFVGSRSSIVSDSVSTGTQSVDGLMGVDGLMCRWGRGPPAFEKIVASLRRVEEGASGPIP